MKKSISTMYFRTTAALLIVSTAVMGLIQMWLVMDYFREDKRQNLNDVVAIASIQFADDSPLRELLQENPELAVALGNSIRLISQTSSTTIFYTDSEGNLLMCSEGPNCTHNPGAVPSTALKAAQSAKGFFETGNLGGLYTNKFYTSGGPVKSSDGAVLGYVFASTSAASLRVFVGDIFSSFILSAGLMLLASSMLAIFFGRRLTTPIRRMSEAARRFGSGDFSVRVPVEGDDELAQLSLTFNGMAQNIETIDQSRASFMGNLAHELRTPMTSIKGFIDGMLDGTIPDEMRQHYLGLVSQEVGRLTRLIQNMLDISKLEAGEYRVNAQSYDVWESVTGVVFSAEQRINAKKIEIQGLAPQKNMVYADQDLVYQVLYNILDNAIKFTPEGGSIRFAVQKSGGQVTVSVRNTGDGIAADMLPYVFERFYKGDQSRGLNTKGSGLGLHICKVLVSLSGGKIWAESEQGQWTQFCFTLPCEEPASSDWRRILAGRQT